MKPPTYILCTICNTALFCLLFFFHLYELTDEHDNENIYFCKIASFFLLIYLFTGIIGLLPFHLLENKYNPKNIIAGNLCLFLGVIIKNCLHLLLTRVIHLNNHAIYWIKGLLFVLCSWCYIIIFLCCINPKKKYNEIYEYSKGKLTLIKNYSTITLEFQKTKEYFKSFFLFLQLYIYLF